MKIRLLEENGAIRRAKEFLHRQKHTLKKRQQKLSDARQEWRQDMREQQVAGLTPTNASFLEDVRLGLERVSIH